MGIGTFLRRDAKEVSSGMGIEGGLQDWAHAAKVFAAEDLLRSPKYRGLFHVNFVFDTETLNSSEDASDFAETIGSQRNCDVLSVLTKSIDLPKFNIEHTVHNQYNKSTITYKKIKYNPISVTFHDDMSDIIWAFWAFYYNWYFADGTKYYVKDNTNSVNRFREAYREMMSASADVINEVYDSSLRNLQDELAEIDQLNTDRLAVIKPGAEWEEALKYPLLLQKLTESEVSAIFSDAWGMNGSVFHSTSSDRSFHLLKQIEIFPLGQKQASMVVLHNPKITSWDHDSFDYSQTATATCKMDIAYEGVSYMDQISAASVLESVRFYDRHASSLALNTPEELTAPGGVLDSAEGLISSISKEKPKLSNVIKTIGAAKTISRKAFPNTLRSILKDKVKKEIANSSVSALNNKIFPNKGTPRYG